jgi:transposase
MSQYDYRGKTVYVGIDVHKKTYSCVSICEGKVVKRDSMPGMPGVILSYLKKAFLGAIINTVYEAGFSGFHLHRQLVLEGINNQVVHPGSIEVASRDRVKTDKRDALKMATQLAAGRLRGIHVPSQEREEKRSVTRLRENLLKQRHQVGQQMKSLLFTQGLIASDDDSVVCKKWLCNKLLEVEGGGYSKDFCFSVNQYVEQWLALNDRMKGVETRLKQQSKEDESLQAIYESVPGIGPIHARQLLNELGDMKQFRNERQLFSFTGLTPSEHSSGEHIRQGNISRQGNSRLRKILVEAAWVAIGKDPNLQEVFDRISNRRGKKRAIVGVARRLAGRIRSCISTGALYEIKPAKEDCLFQESVCATTS